MKTPTKVSEVHISEIKHGDTVLCEDGRERTVNRKDIKHGGFCGTTLFGDSYRSGYKLVKKVLI